MIFKYLVKVLATDGIHVRISTIGTIREDAELGWDVLEAMGEYETTPWLWPYEMGRCALHEHVYGSKY